MTYIRFLSLGKKKRKGYRLLKAVGRGYQVIENEKRRLEAKLYLLSCTQSC